MTRRRTGAAVATRGGGNNNKKKMHAAQVSTAAALKESQGSEGGMVESPIGEAATAVGRKKMSKTKKGAGPIPPATAPAPDPPEVSKLKFENSKYLFVGRINGRRRRRRRAGQTPPPATPPEGKAGNGGSPRGKVGVVGSGGRKRPTQGRNRGKATECGGPNTKRSSGKCKVIIKKREIKARVPGIFGYLLVLQWPGGVEKSGKPLKTEFSSNGLQQHLYLHGLWPLHEGQDDTYERISKKSNDSLQLKDLSNEDRKLLDVYFPSIIHRRSNIKFWGLEWMRHGKAAASIWKILDATNYKARYLMESVSIFLKYRQKIENALHGLQAKMKDPEAQDIVSEIHREIGHTVKIQAVECEGCHYLYQIHLSLDTSLSLQDYYAGSMNDKRLYANCKACHQINIPSPKSEFMAKENGHVHVPAMDMPNRKFTV